MSSIQSLLEKKVEEFKKEPLLHLSQTNGDSTLWLSKEEVVKWLELALTDLLSKQRTEMVNILKKELEKVNVDFETIKYETLQKAIILLQSNK